MECTFKSESDYLDENTSWPESVWDDDEFDDEFGCDDVFDDDWGGV